MAAQGGVMTISIRTCVDVHDIETGIAFYTKALGLTVGRRLGGDWVELLGASSPIDLLANLSGTSPCPDAHAVRDYGRHWTPVHLDFVVDDLDAAVMQARAAGATLDRDVVEQAWGRMANMADPFGNGFCLLEMRGRGYDELVSLSA
jgi:predicted enzyme related to lactoylglutathione lyase